MKPSRSLTVNSTKSSVLSYTVTPSIKKISFLELQGALAQIYSWKSNFACHIVHFIISYFYYQSHFILMRSNVLSSHTVADYGKELNPFFYIEPLWDGKLQWNLSGTWWLSLLVLHQHNTTKYSFQRITYKRSTLVYFQNDQGWLRHHNVVSGSECQVEIWFWNINILGRHKTISQSFILLLYFKMSKVINKIGILLSL